MIKLTEEERKAIITLHELLGNEVKTPESQVYAWELFDEYVNLNAFTSAVGKVMEGIQDDCKSAVNTTKNWSFDKEFNK